MNEEVLHSNAQDHGESNCGKEYFTDSRDVWRKGEEKCKQSESYTFQNEI